MSFLELREGSFEFVDNVNVKRNGTQKLFPRAPIMGGTLNRA